MLIESFKEAVTDAVGVEGTLILACSTGVDSMVLLDVATRCVPPDRLLVAHFDHATRTESREDGAWLRDYSNNRGIAFSMERALDVHRSEEDLRNKRHQFLRSKRDQTRASAIVLAHHAQDQLETFIFRLVRGTGTNGLAGMKPWAPPYLRPFLQHSKGELAEYAATHRIPYRPDRTNGALHYSRNLIRHSVLPTVFSAANEFGGGRNFLRRFSQTTIELSQIQSLEQLYAETWWREHAVETSYWTRFRADTWKSLDRRLQGSLIRKFYSGRDLHIPDRSALERILDEVDHDRRSFDGPLGFRFEYSCGHCFISNAAQRTLAQRAQLDDLGVTIDADPALQIRLYRDGDRLGHTRLKEIFLEHRIPRLERRLVPVVTEGDSSREVLGFLSALPERAKLLKCDFPYTFLEGLLPKASARICR